MTVDLLDQVLKNRLGVALDFVIALMGLAVSVILVWFGTITTLDAFETGRVTLTATRLPEAWVIVVIPVGGALLALEFIRQAFLVVTGRHSTLEERRNERVE